MKEEGVHFVEGAVPLRVEELENGRKSVAWSGGGSDEFDTVLLAVGRDACTPRLRLDAAGVSVNGINGKIPTRHERTKVGHIYAIGDVIDGQALDPPSAETELTPVAIRAGRLLAHRLYGGRQEFMSYGQIPTTVYTPLEYGACGLSEEKALAKYGSKSCDAATGIEVFHLTFKPLEWTLSHRGESACHVKVICNIADSMRVVGLHICGPNAAEITQGFAVAMRMGATKSDLDATVGIHPSMAEELTTLTTTKSSGRSAEKAGC